MHVNSQSLPGEGEAVANITVLPVPRVNTPPVAVIKPPNQTVTLPTNKVTNSEYYTIDDNSYPIRYQVRQFDKKNADIFVVD